MGSFCIGTSLIPDGSLYRKRHERFDHGIIQDCRSVRIIAFKLRLISRPCCNLFSHLPKILHSCKSVFGHPRLNDGSSPRRMDQTYRHSHLKEQFPTEKVRCRRELRNTFRRALLPAISIGRKVIHRNRCGCLLYAKEPDFRIIRILYLLLMVPDRTPAAAYRLFHIGLTRAEPHFSNEDIADNQRITSRLSNCHRVWASGLRRTYLDHPTTV